MNWDLPNSELWGFMQNLDDDCGYEDLADSKMIKRRCKVAESMKRKS